MNAVIAPQAGGFILVFALCRPVCYGTRREKPNDPGPIRSASPATTGRRGPPNGRSMEKCGRRGGSSGSCLSASRRQGCRSRGTHALAAPFRFLRHSDQPASGVRLGRPGWRSALAVPFPAGGASSQVFLFGRSRTHLPWSRGKRTTRPRPFIGGDVDADSTVSSACRRRSRPHPSVRRRRRRSRRRRNVRRRRFPSAWPH